MKRLAIFIIILFSFLPTITLAQIGIGTTQPQETLHVVGTLRVEGSDDVNETSALIGADAEGTLTSLNIDSNLSIIENRLEITGSYEYEFGSVDLSTTPIVSGEIIDLELNLGEGESNEGKTIIYLNNLPANVKLTGIQDGMEGMHIFLYNTSTKNIQFLDESTLGNNSSPKNKIKVLLNNETISGLGCIELLYDGVSQKWLFLSIHD